MPMTFDLSDITTLKTGIILWWIFHVGNGWEAVWKPFHSPLYIAASANVSFHLLPCKAEAIDPQQSRLADLSGPELILRWLTCSGTLPCDLMGPHFTFFGNWQSSHQSWRGKSIQISWLMDNLHICEGTFNAKRYTQLLEQHMLPSTILFQGHHCLLQQDNETTFCRVTTARPHSWECGY